MSETFADLPWPVWLTSAAGSSYTVTVYAPDKASAIAKMWAFARTQYARAKYGVVTAVYLTDGGDELERAGTHQPGDGYKRQPPPRR